MPLAFYICAVITALLLIFELAQIAAALGNIRETLDIIHRDLYYRIHDIIHRDLYNRIHNDLVLLFGKPGKQREYWRDQNGFKHWRKVKDA